MMDFQGSFGGLHNIQNTPPCGMSLIRHLKKPKHPPPCSAPLTKTAGPGGVQTCQASAPQSGSKATQVDPPIKLDAQNDFFFWGGELRQLWTPCGELFGGWTSSTVGVGFSHLNSGGTSHQDSVQTREIIGTLGWRPWMGLRSGGTSSSAPDQVMWLTCGSTCAIHWCYLGDSRADSSPDQVNDPFTGLHKRSDPQKEQVLQIPMVAVSSASRCHMPVRGCERYL